ncbi:MAG: hypothetical protein AAB443_04145 [Patescibacteria group bacterium]|mgnify:CR=1 FL=1
MPEDIVAQEAVKVEKKRPFKKLTLILLVGFVILILLVGGVLLLASSIFRPPEKKEEIKEEIKKDVTTINPTKIITYRIKSLPIDSVFSFIHIGQATARYSPLTAYNLTNENKIFTQALSLLASSQESRGTCFADGENPLTFSQDRLATYCLEARTPKELIIKKIDLKTKDYKEFIFETDFELFSLSPSSRVISSRDGDQALIYSSFGTYILESSSGNLYKMDFPSNLSITKTINISNVEAAFITDINKIYRVNFSNHKGGIFDVNFIGLTQENLRKGLETTRLAKDGRRLVFTISDKIEELPPDKNPNYQAVVAYNIDLATAKISDELNYEEKFLVSCKNLMGSKYCVYKSLELNKDSGRYIESYVLKEFDLPFVEIAKFLNRSDKYTSHLQTFDYNQDFMFLETLIYEDPNRLDETLAKQTVFVYKTAAKKLQALSYY